MFIMSFTGVRLSGIPACSSCHLQVEDYLESQHVHYVIYRCKIIWNPSMFSMSFIGVRLSGIPACSACHLQVEDYLESQHVHHVIYSLESLNQMILLKIKKKRLRKKRDVKFHKILTDRSTPVKFTC